jgi:hypothetical protein
MVKRICLSLKNVAALRAASLLLAAMAWMPGSAAAQPPPVNLPLTDAQRFDQQYRNPARMNNGVVVGAASGTVVGSGGGIVYGSGAQFANASYNNAYNPYDPYQRYCRPCARNDYECRRLKKKYCIRNRYNQQMVATGPAEGGAGIVYSSTQAIVHGSGGGGALGGGFGGASSSSAGAAGNPSYGVAYNLGIPFPRSDEGNSIAARNLTADLNYQIQLYQWQVARKTAEWQAMKNDQLRREQEWNDMMARRMQAEEQARAQAEAAKQQTAQAAPPEESPGIAGSFFSIRNNQFLSSSAENKSAAETKPTLAVQAESQPTGSVLRSPAQTELRPPRSDAEKASVLRQFKRSLFGI